MVAGGEVGVVTGGELQLAPELAPAMAGARWVRQLAPQVARVVVLALEGGLECA